LSTTSKKADEIKTKEVKKMKTEQTIQIEQLPIGDLRPDPANPRRISDQELETLTRSISEFGLVDPIIARREDKTVIGGHQRLLAARKLGYKTIPVVLGVCLSNSLKNE
jgi:ParB-like chromosome segregation protein Spo0J